MSISYSEADFEFNTGCVPLFDSVVSKVKAEKPKKQGPSLVERLFTTPVKHVHLHQHIHYHQEAK